MSPLVNPLIGRLKLRSLQAALCVCMGAPLVAGHAHAQPVPPIGATSTIANGTAAGVTGAFAVNETAGLNNAQANQITVSTGGVVGNDNASVQSATVAAKVTNARASIEANAFSNSSGAVLVNQSAGQEICSATALNWALRRSESRPSRMGSYPRRPRKTEVWGNQSGFIAYARQPSPAMHSRTSAGSCRSTRQPAPVMPRQTVLCSVPGGHFF
jgi:hypothetical protein